MRELAVTEARPQKNMAMVAMITSSFPPAPLTASTNSCPPATEPLAARAAYCLSPP